MSTKEKKMFQIPGVEHSGDDNFIKAIIIKSCPGGEKNIEIAEAPGTKDTFLRWVYNGKAFFVVHSNKKNDAGYYMFSAENPARLIPIVKAVAPAMGNDKLAESFAAFYEAMAEVYKYFPEMYKITHQ